MEYNDPLYVKFEKLDILYKLTDEKNYENIINELKNYAITEYNQEIIIKSFKYLAAICFKFPKSADFFSKSLQDILNHGENFISNQAIIVSNDYLRKYKSSKSLELLKFFDLNFAKKINLPESKSALLYIIGEYNIRIKESIEILNYFSGNFCNENERVKTQILNAVVKIYISNSANSQAEEITKFILQKSAEESENPDLRDRAYIFWRLLENDPDSAKEILLGEKPDFIYKEENKFNKELLNDLIENLTNISCLYQKNSVEFLLAEDLIIGDSNKEKDEESDNKDKDNDNDNDNDNNNINNNYNNENHKNSKQKKNKNKINEAKINQNDFDLLGLGETGNSSTINNNNINMHNINIDSNVDIMDIFGFSNKSNTNSTNNFLNNNNINNIKNNNDMFSDIQFLSNDNDDDDNDNDTQNENSESNLFKNSSGISKSKPFLALDKNTRGKNGINGLKISGLFHREKQNIFLGLHFENNFNSAMSNFSIEIQKNPFGLNLNSSNEKNKNILNDFQINSEIKKNLILEIFFDKQNSNSNLNLNFPLFINITIRNNIDDFEIKIPLYFNLLNLENGKMSNQNFMEFFKKNSNNKILFNLNNKLNNDINNEDSLNKIFEKNNIFLVAKNNKNNPPVFFFSGLLENNIPYVFEVSFNKGKFLLLFFLFLIYYIKITKI
jgi:AP-1 complex subunit beta-1